MNVFELMMYEMNELFIPELLMTMAIVAWGLWTRNMDKTGQFESEDVTPKSH